MEGMGIGGGTGERDVKGKSGTWYLHQRRRGGSMEVPRFKLGGAGERYILVLIGDKKSPCPKRDYRGEEY